MTHITALLLLLLFAVATWLIWPQLHASLKLRRARKSLGPDADRVAGHLFETWTHRQ